ncbi:MAG TPA: hypothetical protein PKE45_05240 [Caldilineaceae bacterium]|nr:hypothetical protein [Caldilineaceae bacterium]
MDTPHRIKVKYFVQDPARLELPALTPVFHRWIQERRVPGMLLDVADYKHVQDGPGIVLIGHEADYSLDLTGGRPGLVYARKRGWEEGDALAERVRQVFQAALVGCQALESDLTGGLRFKLDEAELSLVDRLATPNNAENYATASAEIRPVFDELYGHDNYTLSRASDDPRRTLTLVIQAAASPLC